MTRRPAFSLAYTHEQAFASQMSRTFATPDGIPAQMQAILDQLDMPRLGARGRLADRMEAIRQLAEAEAG